MGVFYVFKLDKWYQIAQRTTYSQAPIIKHKNESTKAFLLSWIGIFGGPRKLVSDNGGEFIGEDLLELCKTFNIKATITALYSP